ncbi:MAG: Maf family protein [Myxococcota bacterium]
MTPELWLASGSPRRRELLTALGYVFEARPTGIDETRRPGDDPVAHARRLAVDKAHAADADAGWVVLAADTVVHAGDAIYDKPTSRDEARAHLRAMSGGWHAVTTGVCVRHGTSHDAFTVSTRVRLRTLLDSEIDRYLATGDADDKAGAYGIQSGGGVFVAELQGSWTNVVGLPLEPTVEALARAGVERA